MIDCSTGSSSSEGSIAQSCAGSWNVAGSNIRRSKSPAASGCDELTVVRQVLWWQAVQCLVHQNGHKWKYGRLMRNASDHNYWNSSFIVDLAIGQITCSPERISSYHLITWHDQTAEAMHFSNRVLTMSSLRYKPTYLWLVRRQSFQWWTWCWTDRNCQLHINLTW